MSGKRAAQGGFGFVELTKDLRDAVERRDTAGAFNAWLTLGERLDVLAGRVNTAPTGRRTARKADGGIQAGDALHVTPDGDAYRAVASDDARYCTDWAESVRGGQVTLGGADGVLNMLTPVFPTAPRLWLSMRAGCVTDREPLAEDGALIRQPVAVRTASYSDGKAGCRFGPETQGEAR